MGANLNPGRRDTGRDDRPRFATQVGVATTGAARLHHGSESPLPATIAARAPARAALRDGLGSEQRALPLRTYTAPGCRSPQRRRPARRVGQRPLGQGTQAPSSGAMRSRRRPPHTKAAQGTSPRGWAGFRFSYSGLVPAFGSSRRSAYGRSTSPRPAASSARRSCLARSATPCACSSATSRCGTGRSSCPGAP
jgi:hypothetical protein